MGEKIVVELNEMTARTLREKLPQDISVGRFIGELIEVSVRFLVRAAGEETEEDIATLFNQMFEKFGKEIDDKRD